MNNQLIRKEELSIFEKIKIFLKNIFLSKKKEKIISQKIGNNDLKRNSKFEESLKIDILKKHEKNIKLNNLLQEIENNPELLFNLSNDRLDKLINYYENITNLKQRKIERLRTFVANNCNNT